MPRSKRNRVVSLTQTKSKGRDLKQSLVTGIREAADEYENLFVLHYENMRSSSFKDVRIQFRDSRIFMAKNKVMQIALGRTPEEEYKDNLRRVSERVTGNVALLFTNQPVDFVLQFFKNWVVPEFAKGGHISPTTIVLNPGPLEGFPVMMLDQFRKLGLIAEVEQGKIVLREPFTAAQEGEPLSHEQCKVLEKLDAKLVNFTIQVDSFWSNGEFSDL